ncbi:MAG: hypothetical protein IT435_03235 [Phycisphaerales bacterium]|nr:hypothetical protein [Phycisphaerales bacterium]
MSFRITDGSWGREESVAAAPSSLEDMRDRLPFPTEAWRRMLSPGRQDSRSASNRKPHPAELALADVERHFARAVISINELMDSQARELDAPDDWRPRAA